MTRRRWIADEVSGDEAVLTGRNAEHLSRVLRARIGQQFEIATGEGVRLGVALKRTRASAPASAPTECIPGSRARRPGSRSDMSSTVKRSLEWPTQKPLGPARCLPLPRKAGSAGIPANPSTQQNSAVASSCECPLGADPPLQRLVSVAGVALFGPR